VQHGHAGLGAEHLAQSEELKEDARPEGQNVQRNFFTTGEAS
jgi:hypothetical protein